MSKPTREGLARALQLLPEQMVLSGELMAWHTGGSKKVKGLPEYALGSGWWKVLKSAMDVHVGLQFDLSDWEVAVAMVIGPRFSQMKVCEEAKKILDFVAGWRRHIRTPRLLEGDRDAVCRSLRAAGEPLTLRGAASLLQRCVDASPPLLLTTATAHGFCYEGAQRGQAAADATPSLEASLEAAETWPSAQQVLDDVVLPLCRRRGLPLSLRMGTRRAVNPALRLAGDGAGPAGLSSLGDLCRSNADVKFLATVLERGDQHGLAVLASRFRNLHAWGCWWHCSNPSVVCEVTALRLEMLGSGFTFQASSARVHDQLIYKWIHARELLARVLAAKYAELEAAGWQVSRGDVRRDARRMIGGGFEEFLAKRL
ncbi:unnamed protein product [Prorocentrum cordatum]|uniref:Uncharacterized protein n=1 Tax=Prorocentrum cordatum TaxID=2364126 RepID=A0ABN9S9P4_9DINO|nr:unnamed protein product [Polarella glacialis]